ncbi:MAG TPA: ABC transporter permease [Bryobacteraceae bacterium]|nr:ABC transporter permease [Bryobacteraceae bacterium]
MSQLWDDLRFGVRLLWRHPSFSVLALLTLALGIGANTAVFSIVRAVLLQPLPYRQPEQLFWFGGREARFGAESSGVSIPDLLDVRRESRTLADTAAYSFFAEKLVVTGTGEPEQVDGMRVTANFFDVLGVRPVLGRMFQAGEDQRGGPRVAVLSHDLWIRSYAGNPDVVGRTITLNSVTHQIVGVMPAGFQFPSRIEVWAPILMGTQATQMREAHSYLAVSRLADGATPELARQELGSIAASLERNYPASNSGYRFEGMTLTDRVTGSVRETLYLLAGITAFLLLIGSANVANLLLARATTRRREVAVRHALGAPRAAIIRQFLAESLVLSLTGGGMGVALAWWAVRALRAWNPAALPRAEELALHPVALAFALGIAVLTALLFGTAPALQATRLDQQEELRDAGTRGGGEGAGRVRLRSFLVVGEIALAVVLLAGAGLLLESLRQLLAIHPGFRTAGVVTTEMTLPMRKFRTLDATAAFVESYLERLRALPGVQTAGAALALPMGSVYSFYEFRIVGDPPQPIPPFAGYTAVTPGYLESMQIPLRQGRLFQARDGRDAPKVVVISEPLAQQYFAGRSAVGQRLRLFTGGAAPFEGEVIGVVGGVRHENLAQQPRVEVYVPLLQSPYPIANVVVRSDLRREALAGLMKQALRELDRDLPLYRIRSMDELVLESAAAPRARGFLTAIFAAAALLLASIGIYGVMSYAVSRRTQEIGIRMAMGATPGAVLRLILGHSGRLVLIGVAVGLALTLALGRLLHSLLFGVSAFDPLVLTGVCALLLAVAVAATSVPAWRAARIDPMRALRQD